MRILGGHSHTWGLVALTLVCALGCGSRDSPTPVSADVVAVVDTVEITQERLARAIAKLYPGEDGAQARQSEEVVRQVLGRIIDVELLVKAADKRGLDRDLKVRYRVRQRQRELMLEELFRRGIVSVVTRVTAAAARQYFDHHHIGEQRRVRRILAPSPRAATQVVTRLRNGEDFATLAAEISDDPATSASGGDLGWMSRLSFRNFMLRRQVFAAEPGQLIGPVQEPDGYSVLTVESVRQVSFSTMEEEVKKAVLEEKESIATFNYLSQLADDATLEVEDGALAVLWTRLRDSDSELPQLRPGEARQQLLRHGDEGWKTGDFLDAMTGKKDPVEIVDIGDLRRYVRRLYAYYILLPERARELGLDETEAVRTGVRKERRVALLDRLREVEVTELIDVSDDEVEAYYDNHVDTYYRSERISIVEVLVDTREQAKGLMVELEQGGDIEELARKYTMRSTRIRRAGGRIQLMRPDKYGRVGFQASESQVGEVVGPVKTGQGYSVFEVLKKIPGYQQSFKEVRIRARWHLEQDLTVQRFNDYVGQLRERYSGSVLISEPHLQAFLSRRGSGVVKTDAS